MSKILMATRIVSFVAVQSVSFVVWKALKNTVQPVKLHHKIQFWIGALVITEMVSEKTEPWIDKKLANGILKFEAIMAEAKN